MRFIIYSINTFFVFSVTLILLGHHVHASDDDFNQPIIVDSATQFIDGLKKVSIFERDVIISQGSMNITAAKVEVDAGAGEGNEVFIATGTPATFKQLLKDGTQVSASANEIRYTVTNRIITLIGDAQLAQNASTVSGEQIIFDMINERLSATGSDDENGRVKAIFQPEALQ